MFRIVSTKKIKEQEQLMQEAASALQFWRNYQSEVENKYADAALRKVWYNLAVERTTPILNKIGI